MEENLEIKENVTKENIEEKSDKKYDNTVAYSRKFSKNTIMIISAIVIAAVIVILCVVLSWKNNSNSNDELSKEDLAAYELIYDASYEFKSPSSVRVIAGTVYYNEKKVQWSGWFTLSAANSYGAKTVGYYYIGYLDGEVYTLDLEKYGDSSSLSFAKSQKDLNFDKINEKLAKKWENY